MTEPLKLMCVLAHPDDESLGLGGTLAKYAAEGVQTYLVTATRGERGWSSKHREAYPGPEKLAQIREAELFLAADVLGLQEITFLNYGDGELARVDSAEATGKIVSLLRRVQPQVVVTFDPFGAYGHPDHIAICQFTTAATVAAADAHYAPAAGAPHRVSKLYYLASSAKYLAAYEAALGKFAFRVNGQVRHAVGWDEWAITTEIDAAAYWQQVWQAISCHRSQLPEYQTLASLPRKQHQYLWGNQTFYRAFSLVNDDNFPERDLFEGLRTDIRPPIREQPIYSG